MVNSTFVMVICTLPAFLNATLKGQSYDKTNLPSLRRGGVIRLMTLGGPQMCQGRLPRRFPGRTQ
jgi:hypothetical protein